MARKSTTDDGTKAREAEEAEVQAQRESNLADAEQRGEEMQNDIDRSLAGSKPLAFEEDAGSPAPGTGGGDGSNKISVETTGPFMLQDPYTLNEIESEGCHEVVKTSFIDSKLQSGDLKECEGGSSGEDE